MKQILLFSCFLIAAVLICGCKTCRCASQTSSSSPGRLTAIPAAPVTAEPGWTITVPGDNL